MRPNAKRGTTSPASFLNAVNNERCPGRHSFDRLVPIRYGATLVSQDSAFRASATLKALVSVIW
jgi:hypothetical protein